MGVAGAEHGRGAAIELGEDFAQAWSARGMAVFVPPAIFEKVQRVLDLPMATDIGQQLPSVDGAWVEAGDEVAGVVRNGSAVGGDRVAIDAQREAAAGEAERLADVIGVIQV